MKGPNVQAQCLCNYIFGCVPGGKNMAPSAFHSYVFRSQPLFCYVHSFLYSLLLELLGWIIALTIGNNFIHDYDLQLLINNCRLFIKISFYKPIYHDCVKVITHYCTYKK